MHASLVRSNSKRTRERDLRAPILLHELVKRLTHVRDQVGFDDFLRHRPLARVNSGEMLQEYLLGLSRQVG